ncbi:MAG: hypothetical protein JXX28_18110 [Deltaproteobacteria bacterium]|nr:hypothetical protein [Deltaproteobacteria bacterium]
MLVVLSLLLACAQPPPPVPVERSVSELVSQLEEAAYHHGNGHLEDALVAWSHANRTLEEQVLPHIRARAGSREALEVEVLMGHVRHELDRQKGAPDTWIEPLLSEVQQQLAPAAADSPQG